MVKRRMRTAVGLTLSLSLLLSLLSGATAGAKKAKIKKVEIRTTDSGVVVMKKKERVKLTRDSKTGQQKHDSEGDCRNKGKIAADECDRKNTYGRSDDAAGSKCASG